VADLGEEQTHLLAVVNRPGGFLPDDDFQPRAQKEKRQSFLRGEGLEQVKVVFVPRVGVGSAFAWRSRSAGDAKGNGRHPGSFFALVSYGSSGNWQSLAAKGKEVRDAHGQGCVCGFL
jgi:hypothetical protein